MPLQDKILAYLERHASASFAFWTVKGAPVRIDVLSACDVLYSLKLLRRLDMLADDAAIRFAGLLSGHKLAGGIGRGTGRPLGVHQTAYALGVLNLLEAHGQPVQHKVLRDSGWRKDELLDSRTGCPRWPWYFSHHAWRIGHWIGGIPAIVLSLWRLTPELAEANRLLRPDAVLHSSDALIDRETGLFRTYRVEAFQRVFRTLYRIRHNPVAGDLGGIAHLHWANYATGRLPYKAAPALFDRTWAFMQRRPFMEKVPYCLDFDIVHLARTAIPDGDRRAPQLRARVLDYADAITDFFDGSLGAEYTLHKLPGGLAALHECALMAELDRVPGLDIAPVDVAREAYWI